MESTYMMCFFFNDTATTEIYTLSLHDALPISAVAWVSWKPSGPVQALAPPELSTTARARSPASTWRLHCTGAAGERDRKSTRLNSSHANISYAVFCLKKKKIKHDQVSTDS